MRLTLTFLLVLLFMLAVALYISMIISKLSLHSASTSQVILSLYCIFSNNSICIINGPVIVREIRVNGLSLCLLDLNKIAVVANVVYYGGTLICPGSRERTYVLSNVSIIYIEWHVSGNESVSITLYSG